MVFLLFLAAKCRRAKGRFLSHVGHSCGYCMRPDHVLQILALQISTLAFCYYSVAFLHLRCFVLVACFPLCLSSTHWLNHIVKHLGLPVVHFCYRFPFNSVLVLFYTVFWWVASSGHILLLPSYTRFSLTFPPR